MSDSFWSEQWASMAEEMFPAKQLASGMRLTRRDPFEDLEVSPGLVTGGVRHRQQTYNVQLGVRPLSDSEWNDFNGLVATQAMWSTAVLLGELPPDIHPSQTDDATEVDLIPGDGDLFAECNCGEWGDLCVHSAALLYGVAELIAADPFVLTLIRGRGRYDVKAMVEQTRNNQLADNNQTVQSAQQSPASNEPRGEDTGVSAAAAYRTTLQPFPPTRRAPNRPGQPLTFSVPPPVDSGVQTAHLQTLVTAAAARAHDLLTGEQNESTQFD